LQKEILKEKENNPAKKRGRSEKKLKAKKKKKQVDSDDDDFEVVAQNINKPVQETELPPGSDSDYDSDDKKEVLALATVAVRQGKLGEIVDDAYNRYAWNDHSVTPKWFADNEKKHNVPQLPITKEIVNEIKERFKEINARPMQKVAEAKARKKNRIDNKLMRLRTKANAIAEAPDLPESSKLKQIQKMYAKTKLDPKKETKFVVRKQFQTRSGTSSRGIAAKSKTGGKTKIVDRRMKKEKRALDRKNAKGPNKKSFKGGKGGGGKGGKGGKGGRRGGKL
jgi:AdoMet-dependent rRNA methyltransferase SPB1